jgi:hypothetical protein
VAAAPHVEWVSVAPDRVVVATSAGAWHHRLRPGDPWEAFAEPMTGPGTPETTRNLLDGALASAGRRSGPLVAPQGVDAWVGRLISLYHTTHPTPGQMRVAASRFAAAGREPLASWAREKVVDEHGHDRLALRDLEALGYDAAALVGALVPRRAAALVAMLDAYVRAPDPIGCLGYAYALERLAAERTEAYVSAVQASLPVDATRCLRVHSAAGSDVSHVDDLVAAVAGCSAPERVAVAVAVHATALTLVDPSVCEPVAPAWAARALPYRRATAFMTRDLPPDTPAGADHG